MAVVVLSRGGDNTGRPSLTVSSSEWGWAFSSSCHRAPLSFPEKKNCIGMPKDPSSSCLPEPLHASVSSQQTVPIILFSFACENLIKPEVGAPSCPQARGLWARCRRASLLLSCWPCSQDCRAHPSPSVAPQRLSGTRLRDCVSPKGGRDSRRAPLSDGQSGVENSLPHREA